MPANELKPVPHAVFSAAMAPWYRCSSQAWYLRIVCGVCEARKSGSFARIQPPNARWHPIASSHACIPAVDTTEAPGLSMSKLTPCDVKLPVLRPGYMASAQFGMLWPMSAKTVWLMAAAVSSCSLFAASVDAVHVRLACRPHLMRKPTVSCVTPVGTGSKGATLGVFLASHVLNPVLNTGAPSALQKYPSHKAPSMRLRDGRGGRPAPAATASAARARRSTCTVSLASRTGSAAASA